MRDLKQNLDDKIKPFTVIAIVVFALVSLLHLVRYFLGWEVVVNSVTIPMWLSPLGFIIVGVLAIMLWREMKQFLLRFDNGEGLFHNVYNAT